MFKKKSPSSTNEQLIIDNKLNKILSLNNTIEEQLKSTSAKLDRFNIKLTSLSEKLDTLSDMLGVKLSAISSQIEKPSKTKLNNVKKIKVESVKKPKVKQLTPSQKLLTILDNFYKDNSQVFKICSADKAKNNKDEFTANLLVNTAKKKFNNNKKFQVKFFAKNKEVSKKNATHIKIIRVA